MKFKFFFLDASMKNNSWKTQGHLFYNILDFLVVVKTKSVHLRQLQKKKQKLFLSTKQLSKKKSLVDTKDTKQKCYFFSSTPHFTQKNHHKLKRRKMLIQMFGRFLGKVFRFKTK